jgi:hypothetical protein
MDRKDRWKVLKVCPYDNESFHEITTPTTPLLDL